MNEFLSLFEAIPIYSFLERLAASGSLGQLATVPLIMLLTALAVAIPALVIMGVVALIGKFIKKNEAV